MQSEMNGPCISAHPVPYSTLWSVLNVSCGISGSVSDGRGEKSSLPGLMVVIKKGRGEKGREGGKNHNNNTLSSRRKSS